MPVKGQVRSILYLPLLTALIGIIILYDHSRVMKDFLNAKKTIVQVRAASIVDHKERIVKFIDKTLLAYESDSLIFSLKLSTLSKVNYNTTIGNDMIVFTATGTDPYNKKVHGGDISFKSWLGFKKSLWVNCTGYVVEGVMATD